ncbi:glutamine amidotransferase [Anaerotaenia torta]|uniref:imidazole glycerol phosphate synthase subunit HisH n=1 Tax=Anaerotaenia torta TaxID=433293 RepID=UPI003D19050C
MIAIIDYDAGNLKSVEKALLHIGEQVVITRDRDRLLAADKVILPGVGAFGDAMEKLHHFQLVEVIKEIAAGNKPLLGICLGMQILFERSDEGGDREGLSLLPGEILRIPKSEGLKIPHMGWNSLTIKDGARLYRGVEQQAFVYFVHSYYLKAANPEDVAATTHYATSIDASVERGMIFGCQFHPEKSGDIGLKILKNFARL